MCLPQLFPMHEIDVHVKDGKIDRIEFFAALLRCSIPAAKVAVNKWMATKKLDDGIEADLKTFRQFDKDGSGFIEANELDGLKRLFTLEELDVGIKDGKVSMAEFMAAKYKCYPRDAQAAIDRFEKRSLQKV